METTPLILTDTNTLFPVFLKPDQLNILIVGGGNVGLEKLTAIINNCPEATVTLIAPDILPGIFSLQSKAPFLNIIQRSFEEDDLEGKDILLLATEDHLLNKLIHKMAKDRQILTNVADTPELCDFYLGSIVQKGNLKIGISTNGKSPTVAKRMREVFTEVIPEEMENVLQNMSNIRNRLKGNFSEKVKELNDITSVLSNNQTTEKKANIKKWRVILYVLAAIILMIAGYYIIGFIVSPAGKHIITIIKENTGMELVYFILGGFVAKLIDGTLGLGYGTISTTYLLSFGIMPAEVSKSVHISEIFTSGASGFMHLKYKNVNKKLFRALLIPGIIGAIGGAFLITKLQSTVSIIRPLIAVYTLLLGVNIIMKGLKISRKRKPMKKVGWLGGIGGFLDAVAGGGWGTLVTSTLMASGRNPVYVIGSVNLARFYVSLAGSLTFIFLLGMAHWQVVVGLLIGGIIASPIAAASTRKLPTKKLLILVGILVILLSLRIIYQVMF